MSPRSMGPRVGGAPAGALVLPPAQTRVSAHAVDRPTVALLASTANLLRDMLLSPAVRVEGESASVLFASFKGNTPVSPGSILAAATYVETKGVHADPDDARANHGITAGTLGAVCVSLLNDLSDCLLTAKLHEAFLAAVKIGDYRSRLYVMRLLLDRVPADRLSAVKALVQALALSNRLANENENENDARSSGDENARSILRASSRGDDTRTGNSSLDPVLRSLTPKLLRGKTSHGESNTPPSGLSPSNASARNADPLLTATSKAGRAETNTNAKVPSPTSLDAIRLLVTERRYLLFKGAATVRSEDTAQNVQTNNAGKQKPVQPSRDTRVDRAYASQYSAKKKEKGGSVGTKKTEGTDTRGPDTEPGFVPRLDLKGLKSPAPALKPASAPALVPGESPDRKDPGVVSKKRMERAMAASLEQAVARARKARDMELRLTYVRPQLLDPVAPARQTRVATRMAEENMRGLRHGYDDENGRFPPVTPRASYARMHESREDKQLRLREKAFRKASGEAVSEDDDDDEESDFNDARDDRNTHATKTWDPTNPLRKVATKEMGGGVVHSSPIKSIAPWLRGDNESRGGLTRDAAQALGRAAAENFGAGFDSLVDGTGDAYAEDDVGAKHSKVGSRKAVSLGELKARITAADAQRSVAVRNAYAKKKTDSVTEISARPIHESSSDPTPKAAVPAGATAVPVARVIGTATGSPWKTPYGHLVSNRGSQLAPPVSPNKNTYGVSFPTVPLPEETSESKRERQERARVAVFVNARAPSPAKPKNKREGSVDGSAGVPRGHAREGDTREGVASDADARVTNYETRTAGPPKKRAIRGFEFEDSDRTGVSVDAANPGDVQHGVAPDTLVAVDDAAGFSDCDNHGESGDATDEDDEFTDDSRGEFTHGGCDRGIDARNVRVGRRVPRGQKTSGARVGVSGGAKTDSGKYSSRFLKTQTGPFSNSKPPVFEPPRVTIPTGFRVARPGEAGAIRAGDADAIAASSGPAGLTGETLVLNEDDTPPDANTTANDTSYAGSARLKRIAQRIRGDAPATASRPPTVASVLPSKVVRPASRNAGVRKRASPNKARARGSLPRPTPKLSGSGNESANDAPRGTRASDSFYGSNQSDGWSEHDPTDDVVSPDAVRGVGAVPEQRARDANGLFADLDTRGSPGDAWIATTGESPGNGETFAPSDMFQMFSGDVLERVLREVAAKGGLDGLVEGDEGDDDDDGAVTAEDVAKIVALVKEQRKRQTEEAARLKRNGDGGLRGALATKMVGSGVDETETETESVSVSAGPGDSEAEGTDAETAENAKLKERRDAFANEKVGNIPTQLEEARQGTGKATSAPPLSPPPPPPKARQGVPPPPPPPPPGGKLPGVPPPPPPPHPGGRLSGAPPPPPPPPPGGRFPRAPPPPPPPPGGKLPGAPPPPPPPPGGKLGGAPPPPPPPPPRGKLGGPPPPPPPPGGKLLPGAPPPPPGGGPKPGGVGIASIAASLKVAKVVRKVKMLHWDKLQAHALRGTVWENAGEGVSGVNLADLETLFALEDASKKKTVSDDTSGKPKVVSLIDPKRSLNISIQLAGIRMPFAEIKRAFLGMDDKTLRVDQLNILALAVPTTEEIGLLKAYQGDKKQLATVEQYFLQVMPIPRLSERIGAYCAFPKSRHCLMPCMECSYASLTTTISAPPSPPTVCPLCINRPSRDSPD